MKTLLRLMIIFTILLFAGNVWAQGRPQCPTIELFPGFSLPLPPDPPGACFYSPDPGSFGAWTIFFVYDGTNFVSVFSQGTGDNNFTRFNPHLKGFAHFNDKDGVTASLCSQGLETCYVDLFNLDGDGELEDFWFIGPGKLEVNGGSTSDLSLACPFEIRFKGTVADNSGIGTELKLQAFSTYVINHKPPDPGDLLPGCKEGMTKISIDPID